MLHSTSTLSTFLATNRQQNDLQVKLEKSSAELTSGRAFDLGEHLSGATLSLALLTRKSAITNTYLRSTEVAAQKAQATQIILRNISSRMEDLIGSLMIVDQLGTQFQLNNQIENAKIAFHDVVSLINTEHAGEHLFSGDATQTAALASADDMLASLAAAVSSTTDPVTFYAAIDFWFNDPGGGFATFGYQGSTTGNSIAVLKDDNQHIYSLRADGAALKETLRGLAMAVLANAPFPTLSLEEQKELITGSRTHFLENQTRITEEAGALGLLQEQISIQQAQLEKNSSEIEQAITSSTMIDPFEAVTKLESAQLQLSALYEVIARKSSNSLSSYLR